MRISVSDGGAAPGRWQVRGYLAVRGVGGCEGNEELRE